MEVLIIIVFISLFITFALSRTNQSKDSDTILRNGNEEYEIELEEAGDEDEDREYNESTEIKIPAFTFTVSSSIDEVADKQNDYKWYSKDEAITINGYKIDGGFIYVGSWLVLENNFYYYINSEASLVNPKLEIAEYTPSLREPDIGYYPSYNSISPVARAIYLNWLANGKVHPSIPIGYVFLYYYGLERRLLVDLLDSDPDNEYVNIIDEIKRLLEIYGYNASFFSYATKLVAFISLYKGGDDFNIPENYESQNWGEIPLHFKFSLLGYAKSGIPLPADTALEWLRLSDPFSFRTPSDRCKNEHEELFLIKYRKRYGEGIVLKQKKAKIRISYQAASPSIQRHFQKSTDFCDITRQTKYCEKFKVISREAEDELDAYSRYLGRKPDAVNSIQALLLLPKALINNSNNKHLKEIKNNISNIYGDKDYLRIEVKKLLSLLKLPNIEKITKPDAINIIQFLSKINYGIEPDLRFGSPILQLGGNALLFRINENSPSSPTKEYLATATLITFSSALSNADGSFSIDEEEYIIQQITNSLKLDEIELTRLNAYLKWAFENAKDIKGMTKRIQALGDIQKNRLLNFLLNLAIADGYISPDEIKILKKVYNIIGIEEERLYSDIHQLQTKTSDLTTIIKSHDESEKYLIPSESKNLETVSLNEEVIRKTLDDTERVQEILSNVFEEENSNTSNSQEEIKYDEIVPGLDYYHTELLIRISNKDKWTKSEFEDVCSEIGIMPDGAIENINEAFYNSMEEDFIIENEQLELNLELYKEITA